MKDISTAILIIELRSRIERSLKDNEYDTVLTDTPRHTKLVLSNYLSALIGREKEQEN